MFSDEDLRLMRETQEGALPDEVTIKRNVREDDGFGGATVDSVTTVATDVPARFFPGTAETVLGQVSREIERNVFTFRFARDVDVQDKDILVLQSDQSEYKVEIIKSPRSWQHLKTVQAETYSS